jgi:hypothetical protein
LRISDNLSLKERCLLVNIFLKHFFDSFETVLQVRFVRFDTLILNAICLHVNTFTKDFFATTEKSRTNRIKSTFSAPKKVRSLYQPTKYHTENRRPIQ